MRPLLVRVLALAAGLGPVAAGAAEPRRFGVDDLDQIVRLEGAQISPDGTSVALVVARVNLAENRRDPELVLVDVKTGAQSVLLRGKAGLAHPRFSPRGEAVAFLAEAAGAPQIHVLPVSGGEPRAVTTAPSGVQEYAWRPDGTAFGFTTPDPSESPSGAERFKDAFEVGRNGYLERAAPKPSQLWIVSAEGGEARRITAGGFSLATSLSASPLSFTPDGREVAFTRTITPRSGDSDSARIHIAEAAASGLQRRITLRSGHEHAPAFSPDGSQIVFLWPRDGDPANATEAFVAPATGGDGRSVTGGLDRSITLALWQNDGRSLLVGGGDGARMALWVQPLQGALRKLDLGPVAEYDHVSLAVTGALAFVGTEPGRPQELYVLDPAQPQPRRLTDLGAPIAAMALGRTESLTWPTDDGLTADGILTFPPDFTTGRAWPLVLLIHGGPTGASNEAFEPLAQLMAARGWVVFQPNYRGSDNRGNAFQHAIAAGAGEGPGRDVMAGIEAVKRRGFTDASRIAVSGWSYGGFMTGWLIGRYPEAFRVAVMGAAALDLFDMWSLSDLNAQRRHAFTTSPWLPDREAHFQEQSPLRHVARVRTPTLILSNVADARVAVTQSYKFFEALRDNDVNVRFFAYPTGGHMPQGPVRQKDVYTRWLDWIEGRFTAGS